MKLELKEKILYATTESQQDRERLAEHILRNAPVLEQADFIRGPDVTVELPCYNRISSGWFAGCHEVDETFVDSFYRYVCQITGADPQKLAACDPIDLLPYWNDVVAPHPIGCTHTVTGATLAGHKIAVTGYVQAHDLYGNSAEQNAVIKFKDCANTDFGVDWHPSEYIEHSNGACHRNPRYATGARKILPFGEFPREDGWTDYGKSNIAKHWFTAALFSIWLEKLASPGQRLIVEQAQQLTKNTEWWRNYGSIYCKPHPDLTVGQAICWSAHDKKDGWLVSQEEFKNA